MSKPIDNNQAAEESKGRAAAAEGAGEVAQSEDQPGQTESRMGKEGDMDNTNTVNNNNEVKHVEMTEEENTKTVIEDPTKTVDNKVDESTILNNREAVMESESSETEDEVRRVMFDTDNWEDCITESVWFG